MRPPATAPATLKDRPINPTRIYQLVVFVSALASVSVVTFNASLSGSDDLALAAIICAMVALGRNLEFRISAASSSHLGTPALLAGAMMLPPVLAIFAVGLGVVLNELVHRNRRATLFNIGQSIYQVLVAVGFLHLIGWNPVRPDFDAPLQVAGAVAAGHLAIGVSILLVGLHTWFDRGGSALAAIGAVMGAGNREIYLLDVSKVCIGIIAALLVDWTPLFLFFLLVPVATMSRAIKRGGDLSMRLEIALDETENSLAEAQRLANLGSWEWVLSGHGMTWSDQLYAILGLERGDTSPTLNDICQMLPLPDRNRLEQIIGQVRHHHTSVEFDHEIIHPDGELRYVSHRISWVAADARASERLVGTLHDITERKHLELRLRYQAYHDGLTGLPNREYFVDRLQESLASGRCRAVVFIDLDYFKTINDTHGHEAGDIVLIEVGRRLRQAVGAGDFVARLSGDEFTILAGNQGDAGRVERMAHEILRNLRQPVIVGDLTLQIDASAGVVYVTPHHASPSDVLREADMALYAAKGDGRGRVAVYPRPSGSLVASA